MYLWTESILLSIWRTGTNLQSCEFVTLELTVRRNLGNFKKCCGYLNKLCLYCRLDALCRRIFLLKTLISISFRLQIIFMSDFYVYVRKLQNTV